MYDLIVLVHIITAMLWFGGALIETFYLIPQFKKIKNGLAEVESIRIWASSATYYGPVVLLLLVSGITLSIYGGWGFFESFWLGTKQGIMIAIILILSTVGATNMTKTKNMAKELIEKNQPVNDLLRKQYKKTRIYYDIIHVGVLINVIFAVLRF